MNQEASIQEIISMGFDITHKLLVRFFAFIGYWGGEKWKYNDSTLTIQTLRKSKIQLAEKYYTIFSQSLWYP
jgi:S-formylglutathione hydrolase FrmB